MTTSALLCGVAMGGCGEKPRVSNGSPSPAAPKTEVSFVRAEVTKNRAEYVWEIRSNRHWNPNKQAEGVTSLVASGFDQPETRRISVILEATRFPKGGMDVLLSHLEEHQVVNGQGEARAQTEFIGLPDAPLESLVTVKLNKSKEVKSPAQIPLAELRFAASQFTNLEARKNVNGWPKVFFSQRVRLENGVIPQRVIRTLDPKLLRGIGKGTSVGSQTTKARTMPIEVHFSEGTVATVSGPPKVKCPS